MTTPQESSSAQSATPRYGQQGRGGPWRTSEDPSVEAADHRPRPRPHPCPPSMECNTGAIDDLKCEARAVKAESDTLAEVAGDLEKRRAAFETARSDYGAARDEAAKVVKDVNRKLKDVLAEIRCRLNRDEIDCLDRAFQQVLACLEECPGAKGCCAGDDCGFEKRTWTVDEIDGLRARVTRIEKCFDEVLVTEPAAVRKRAGDLRKLLDALTAAAAAEPRADAAKLYAMAREVRYAADAIWGRFADVNEFQDCLCCALTGSLRGRQLLAQLIADREYLTCQEESRLARCDWLRAHMVEETLAVRLKICPPEAPGDDDREPPRPQPHTEAS